MKFKISVRLFLAFAMISSLGISVSHIAVFSLRSAQDKFDHIATVQLQSFQAAEGLVRQAEELARIAPNLYARRQGNAALIQFAISIYELKSRLQSFIAELEANGPVSDCGGCSSTSGESKKAPYSAASKRASRRTG